MKRLLQGLALVSCSVLLVVLAAEASLRAFPALLPVELKSLQVHDEERPHPDIGGLPAPHSTGVVATRDFRIPHRLDGNGFRNEDPWPDRADVVVIGDSLVFGYGVQPQDAWPQLIETDAGLNVINLGLIGAGPQQHVGIYEHFARGLEPGLVVIGLFLGNDLWDAEQFERWRESGFDGTYLEWRNFGRPSATSLGRLRGRMRYVLTRHSRVHLLARYGARLVRSASGVAPVSLEWRDGTSLLLDPADFEDKTLYTRDPESEPFQILLASIERIQQDAVERGAHTLVVLQPSKEETYLSFLGEPAPDAGALVRRALQERGIDYVDAVPVFRAEAERGALLFFPTDGHPNKNGYRLIAEAVISYLERHHLLERLNTRTASWRRTRAHASASIRASSADGRHWALDTVEAAP